MSSSVLAALRSVSSLRSGVAYAASGGNALYLSLTNELAGGEGSVGLLESRGEGFEFDVSPIEGAEPTPVELATIVDNVYSGKQGGGGSMGEMDGGVVFAGRGDPLLRVRALLDTVSIVSKQRNGISFRVNTSGLHGQSVIEQLTASDLVAIGDDDSRRSTLLKIVSVSLNAPSPDVYAEITKPAQGQAAFGTVCSFISALAEAGVQVECTAVKHPKVDIAATERLAQALGASSFRARSYHAKSK